MGKLKRMFLTITPYRPQRSLTPFEIKKITEEDTEIKIENVEGEIVAENDVDYEDIKSLNNTTKASESPQTPVEHNSNHEDETFEYKPVNS
jgi:hypothetical protein